MEVEQTPDVDRPQAIAVRAHERVALDVLADLLEARPRGVLEPGLGEGDVPVLLAFAGVEVRPVVVVAREREVGDVLAVAEEVLLDQPTLVAQAENEVA